MTLSIAGTVLFRSPPQVQITAASTTGGAKPIPQNTLITSIVRIHKDGTRHPVLTERAPRLIDGAWTWIDIHCPYNQGVTYEITAGGYVSSSIQVYLGSNQVWLLSPSDAGLAFRCPRVVEIASRSTASRAEKFIPIGAQAVYLSDGRRDDIKGSLTIAVTDEAPVHDLIANDEVLLINAPGTAGWDLGWAWVSPTSVTFDNPGTIISYPYRHVKIDFEVCADPDVDLTPAWTSGIAEAYWTGQGLTSGEVVSHYANSLAGVTDTRL